jgi:hypothetical protein
MVQELEMTGVPAPWINQFGMPVHENLYGDYRPNPAYVAWQQANAATPAARSPRRARRARPTRRLQILAVLIVLATFVVGVKAAYGFWTVSGSGTGSATSTTATVSVVAATVPGSPLYPGASGTVRVSINNPNAFAMKLTAVTGTGPITATPTCAPTGVTFTDQTGLNTNLPAGVTTTVDFPNAASMDNTSADGCQGATFSIPVSVSVRQP